MKLDWDRPGVLRATVKVDELAALVAGARLAAAALAAQSPEQADELGRVLSGFDRALTHLAPLSGQQHRDSDDEHGTPRPIPTQG